MFSIKDSPIGKVCTFDLITTREESTHTGGTRPTTITATTRKYHYTFKKSISDFPKQRYLRITILIGILNRSRFTSDCPVTRVIFVIELEMGVGLECCLRLRVSKHHADKHSLVFERFINTTISRIS